MVGSAADGIVSGGQVGSSVPPAPVTTGVGTKVGVGVGTGVGSSSPCSHVGASVGTASGEPAEGKSGVGAEVGSG